MASLVTHLVATSGKHFALGQYFLEQLKSLLFNFLNKLLIIQNIIPEWLSVGIKANIPELCWGEHCIIITFAAFVKLRSLGIDSLQVSVSHIDLHVGGFDWLYVAQRSTTWVTSFACSQMLHHVML